MKDLKLVDVCPRWLGALRTHKVKWDGNMQEHLAIDREKFCLVSEAWGFTSNYNKCEICNEFALYFPMVVHGSTFKPENEGKTYFRSVKHDYFYIINKEGYKKLRKEFLTHFNEAHKEEWLLRH